MLNYLQKKLDQEEQQRLVVLQDAVQKEHESSIRDITDLRCLSTLNERERDRVKAGLDDVGKCVVTVSVVCTEVCTVTYSGCYL